MQDSLNCHRKGGKGGEKADLPAKKLEVSPGKTARPPEHCLGLGHAARPKPGCVARARPAAKLADPEHLTFWSTMEQAISRTCARL